jgi:hypothetical protein
MTLRPKSVLRLLCCGSITIMFYGVRLLASRLTPVNFWGTYDFMLGFTPLAKGSRFKAPPSHSHLLHNPIVHCPWTTTRRMRVWVCWQSLQVEHTGSFLVFNRACLLASACPTSAVPDFGPDYETPHYAVSSCLLSVHLFDAPVVSNLGLWASLMWETRFYTRTK